MRYFVKTACAHMPASCWGRYRRVAVLAVEDGCPEPRTIRAGKGVTIIQTWERCNVGKTGMRCAYGRAVTAAEELAADLTARRRLLDVLATGDWRKVIAEQRQALELALAAAEGGVA